MKKLMLFLPLLLTAFSLTAQQEHHYTQFMYNKLPINPGYAGSRGVPTINGLYRNQWAGFDGAPTSFLIGFNSNFLSPRVGVGITASHHEIGLQSDFQGSMAYSYDVIGREDISVRLGIMATVRSLKYNFSKARPADIDDYLNNVSNPANVSNVYANIGGGIYATGWERLYVGVSVPRINSNNLGLNRNAPRRAKDSPHWYAMAGAVLPVSKDLNFMPSVLVKFVENAPWSSDLNLSIEVRRKITAGLSFRLDGDPYGKSIASFNSESVDLLFFWQATEKIGVGAAYDFTLSDLRDYTAGSFELFAQADLKTKKKSRYKKLINPRFFM